MSNWFQKLGFGLKKTSTRLTSGITDIFINAKSIRKRLKNWKIC